MKDWNENIWFSPCYAIYNFRDLVSKVGVKKAFNKKKELEAYITGITLLGVNRSTQKYWWLQIPESDPPDACAATMGINENNIGVLDIQEVEVFRIEDYIKEDIPEAIKRKLHNKAYDSKTVLIGLINRDEEVKNIQEINEELLKGDIKVSSIWLLGNKSPQQDRYVVFEVFPKVQVHEIDLEQECNALKQVGHMMRVSRSTAFPTAIHTQIHGKEASIMIPKGQY